MTQPVEDVEKLARELAEAITAQIDATSNARALLHELTTAERFNVYTAGLESRLEERDAELQRLRAEVETLKSRASEVTQAIAPPPQIYFV